MPYQIGQTKIMPNSYPLHKFELTSVDSQVAKDFKATKRIYAKLLKQDQAIRNNMQNVRKKSSFKTRYSNKLLYISSSTSPSTNPLYSSYFSLQMLTF